MFNVSALLLDDALKLAMLANQWRDQWNADISQGSVATHLRCGGIFNDSIIIVHQEKLGQINFYISSVFRRLRHSVANSFWKKRDIDNRACLLYTSDAADE